MAQWFLNRPSTFADASERMVAQVLRQLPDNWLIRWGYYYEDNAGQTREGDFLILAPTGGVLVLEVKSGNLRHWARKGTWGADKSSQAYPADHPLRQLDEEWAAVRRRLKLAGKTPPYAERALVLPGVTLGHAAYVSGIPRRLLLDARDLENFGTTWQRHFEAPEKKVTPEQRECFLSAYGQTALEIDTYLQQNEDLFRRHFTAGFALLEGLQGNRQIIVKGPSGSGKSWYAVEQSLRWAGEGAQVLLLCFNLALATRLRDLIHRHTARGKGVTVWTWETLAEKVLGACEICLPKPRFRDVEAVQQHFGQKIPAALQQCLMDEWLRARMPQFDALVVDEAQDHDTHWSAEAAETPGSASSSSPGTTDNCGWWEVYFACLRHGASSRMALFLDEAQRPSFRGKQGFQLHKLRARMSQPAHVQLRHALRYTRPIYTFLNGLEGEGTMELRENFHPPADFLEGPDVELWEAEDCPVAWAKAVESIVARWQTEGICPTEEILLLYPRSHLEATPLAGRSEVGGVRLKEYSVQQAGQASVKPTLRHCSIHKAKGLDARGVILLGMGPFATLPPSFQHTYFMGAARARQALAVIHRRKAVTL